MGDRQPRGLVLAPGDPEGPGRPEVEAITVQVRTHVCVTCGLEQPAHYYPKGRTSGRRKRSCMDCEERAKTEKICTTCKQVLPIDEFRPQKAGCGGRAAVCRGCNARARRHKRRNRQVREFKPPKLTLDQALALVDEEYHEIVRETGERVLRARRSNHGNHGSVGPAQFLEAYTPGLSFIERHRLECAAIHVARWLYAQELGELTTEREEVA